MSTDTPQPADDQPRAHTEEPAEGAEPGDHGADVRQHATDPAEGKDPADP